MVFVRDGFEVDADWIIREQKAGDLLEHGVVSPLRFLSTVSPRRGGLMDSLRAEVAVSIVTSKLNFTSAVLGTSMTARSARQYVLVTSDFGERPLPGYLHDQPHHHEEYDRPDGE